MYFRKQETSTSFFPTNAHRGCKNNQLFNMRMGVCEKSFAQLVVRASATFFRTSQYTLVYQVFNISICGVLRTMVYLVPLRGVEFSFKAIKEFVDDLALAVIERRCAVLVPKGGLADDIVCFAQGFRNGFPKSLSGEIFIS